MLGRYTIHQEVFLFSLTALDMETSPYAAHDNTLQSCTGPLENRNLAGLQISNIFTGKAVLQIAAVTAQYCGLGQKAMACHRRHQKALVVAREHP